MNTSVVRKLTYLCILLAASAQTLFAASNGTWINDASSVWSAGTNWAGFVVADGTDATADFSTVNITTNRTVTLDSSRNIGNVLFGNPTTLTNWTLNASGGSVLTLAASAGSPTITVTNTAIVTAPLAGTSGLAKAGSGTLVLGGTNNYSGTNAINVGTLQLTNIVNTAAASNAPVLYFSFDNVVNGTVINQGSGGPAMNGVLLGSAAIVPGGRYGSALSIPSGVASFNYVLVNSAVVPLTGPAPSTWTVAMWVQTTTAGGAYFYQGSGGWVSGNTEFYLENGTQGDGAGTHQGGVRNSQAWVSGTANVNDGSWHFLVMTSSNNVRTMYFDGALDATLSGAGSWTGTGVGAQVRIGGAAAGADSQVALNGLVDEVYVYNRALSQAEVTTVMNTASGPTFRTPLPAASAVAVAAAGKLDMNGNTAVVSSLSGVGTVDNTVGAGLLTVTANSNVEFDGIMTNTAGTLAFTKLGNGTMTLAGTNYNTGPTAVGGGTLNVTGSIKPVNPAATTSTMTVGNGAGNSVLNFSGPFLTNWNYNIATVTNAVGALYQTAGFLTEQQGANGSAFQLGSAPGAFGYYYMGGGTNFCGEIGIGGEVQPSGNGIMDLYGGTVIDTGYLVISRNGTGTGQSLVPQTGVLNVFGGVLRYSTVNGAGINCNWGSAGTSIINIMGGTVANGAATGFQLNNTGNAGNTGILNLNGGVAQAFAVTGGLNGTRINFNGGTLQASAANPTFMLGLGAANIYGGGGTINNNGFAITIGQQFLAPTGNGVNGIASFTPGAGYIEPPIVTVVGDGVGATAIAQINLATGTITNVLITCPGVNYSSTPTFVLMGGGATTPATITGTPPTANTTGGLAFTGSGTTILTGGYTYTGPTMVLGGTLTVTPSTVTPSIAGNLVLSNASLSLASSGVTLPAGNLIFQVSNNLNIAYGTIFANPAVAAITASGGITAGATNIINITGFGLKAGTFTVIKYGTGTLSAPSFANFALNLPPGVAGFLVNNTGSQSIDVTISSSPNQLTWSGVGSTNWDTGTFNWTNNATGLAALYQQYTNAGIVAGDGVVFDDTLTNDFVNPQPTNINLTTIYTPFPVTVNSTLPYKIAGPGGIAGIGNFIKNNTGSLTLLTSNGFSGGFAINGGSVIVTNDFSLGASAGTVTLNGSTLQFNGNTTNNSRVLTVTAASTVDVAANVSARIGGAVSGAGGLTKTDDGTFVIGGTNSLTGAVVVSQGTLLTAGNNNLTAVVTVGNTAGVNGTLNVSAGTFNAINNGGQFASGLLAGSVASSAGDIRLGGGTLSVLNQFGLGAGVAGYAAFNMSGGTLIAGSFIVVGFNNDQAVFNQSAGATTVTTNLMTIAAGGTGSVGVANFSGGTYIATNSAAVGNNTTRGGLLVGENGNGTLNVSGTATVTAGGQTNLTLARNAGSIGTVNLDGGTIITPVVAKGAGLGVFNFNGGVLKATAANPNFVSGLNSAFVYNGGATIDDSGFAVTIPQPLLGAVGFGVATIPITAGGAGYIDTPIVTISGGNGSNAMATATVAGGVVTAVTVTCPGGGYQNGDSLSVSFSGGGASPTQPTVGTITFAANGTGGFTKRGAGTTTLTGQNSISGPVTVSGGTLAINTTTSNFGATTVTNGATLAISQVGANTETIGNLTLGVTAGAGATVSLALANGNSASAFLTAGTLTVNASNNVALAGRFTVGTFPLIKYTGSIAGLGSVTNVTLPQGVSGYISNNAANSTIYAVITSTGPGLVWTGTNSAPGLATVWDIGSTTNWVLGTTPTIYQQSVPPGDSVTFNDVGEGVVTVSNTVSPFSLLISNNAVTYTFQGPGHVAGIASVTKLGTGTATMNVTNNNYTGDTVISNGTLVTGSATVLGTGGNLNIGPLGTLELGGFSQAVNGLSGGGVIDDNSANNATLTFGNGGSGLWSGTMHDQGLGGGLSFTKTGNNTLVFSGSNYLSSPTASQVNAGLLILTNNGLIGCANSEFWIAQGAGSTSTVVVASGSIVTSNNWFVIGRNAATANGTLIVNGGTVQKAGANNIVVGSLGASGSIIVNGGQVLNNGMLWLGESPSAIATLYLNGGLIQGTQVRPNDNGGLPAVTPIAYFNGGTLQATASSADYLQVQSEVMSNGFILDDNGFTLSILSQILLDGDGMGGGMIKKGSGTVYLEQNEQYSGTTLVTNGTLAGNGSVLGSLVVAPAGNLGAGNTNGTGTFTVNNNLTLQGNATLRVNKTGGSTAQDQISVTGNVDYGGILTIVNITSDANVLTTSDSFPIFSVLGSHANNFTGISGSPGAGLAYSFDPATGILSIVTQTISPNPTNITFTVTGNTLRLGWPEDHRGWFLQAQTNTLGAGLSNNWFDVPGSDANTNAVITINPVNPDVFYRLRHP